MLNTAGGPGYIKLCGLWLQEFPQFSDQMASSFCCVLGTENGESLPNKKSSYIRKHLASASSVLEAAPFKLSPFTGRWLSS